jgi:hypothetical protein
MQEHATNVSKKRHFYSHPRFSNILRVKLILKFEKKSEWPSGLSCKHAVHFLSMKISKFQAVSLVEASRLVLEACDQLGPLAVFASHLLRGT